MYFIGWMGLLAISLWISVVVFIWAIQTGQFSDQGRARYLPLADGLPPVPKVKASKITIEVYALAFIFILGLAVMAASLIVSLHHS